MNIISVNPAPGAFANGFGYFCTNCGRFFSAQIEDDMGKVECCPYCGEYGPLTTVIDLLHYCADYDYDPANFHGAFPLDEPIPQSDTGATPRQVRVITSMAMLGRRERRPVTVGSIAAESGYPQGMVAKVFDELHITESGAAA